MIHTYVAMLNDDNVLPFDITFEAISEDQALYKAKYLLSEYFDMVGRWNMKNLSVFKIKDLEIIE